MGRDVETHPHVFALGVSSHHGEADGSQPFLPYISSARCVVTVKKRQTMQMNWSLLESDGFLSAGDMDMLHFENVPPTA